jgi:hypothetical protein
LIAVQLIPAPRRAGRCLTIIVCLAAVDGCRYSVVKEGEHVDEHLQ